MSYFTSKLELISDILWVIVEAFSKACWTYDEHAYSEPWHFQSPYSEPNHFQGFLGVFRDIDAYSATLTGPQLGRKTFPDFGKRAPNCAFDEIFIEIP